MTMCFASCHTVVTNKTCCEQSEHRYIGGSFSCISPEFQQDWLKYDVIAKIKRVCDLLYHSVHDGQLNTIADF